ncbi:MAG: hypothetical protein ABEH64_06540 [Salinirussus sp.]
MAPAEFTESSRYGAVLYAYVLGVLVVGGGGLALGAALLWPEIQAWRGPGVADTARAIGGGVLAFLGFSVLTIGGYAVTYKLIADGVAAGMAAGQTERSSTTTPAANSVDGTATDKEEDPPEPSPSEIAWGTTDGPEADDTGSIDESLPGEDAGSDPLGERTE